MRITYTPETDTVLLETRDVPTEKTREVAEGIVINLDENNLMVGLIMGNASKYCDLNEVVAAGVTTLKFGS